eukprot:14515789-Alexandrium_andersonii.AAC.1
MEEPGDEGLEESAGEGLPEDPEPSVRSWSSQPRDFSDTPTLEHPGPSPPQPSPVQEAHVHYLTSASWQQVRLEIRVALARIA